MQTLENQITDIATQLQPTANTYPILINLQPLQKETDPSAIAQEFCNQIYQTLFPNSLEIPEINNAAQLKRLFPQLKQHLKTQNIALILDKNDPYPQLETFCRQLSNGVAIAWLTEQPLEPPLRGFLPTQFNLVNVVQNWIQEIE
ncbi:hypothetical protein [Gloeothece citriformis]|uniref:NACHT C-terminal alpha/beta 1 domain-containing protein n=1 Tax=Gloeothece citriformis TaxID=2546356 RepID=UPI003B8362F4